MVDKELIEIWRNMLKPSISSRLLKTNYEGRGEQDKEEFERDFDEILDLALIGLKHKAQLSQEGTTTDTISRQAAIRWVKTECNPYGKPTLDFESGKRVIKHLEQMPPAQPEWKTALWIIRKWGDDAKCSNCGHTFRDVYDMDNHDRFCRFCGRRMIGVKGETT